MPTTEDAVRAANEGFYEAFRAADAERMSQVWAASAPVLCIHPGWGVLREREAVIESWRNIFENPGSPAIECSDVAIALFGLSAIVTCREGIAGQDAALVATNVFVLEEDEWRMVHHHAGPVARAKAPRAPDRTLN